MENRDTSPFDSNQDRTNPLHHPTVQLRILSITPPRLLHRIFLFTLLHFPRQRPIKINIEPLGKAQQKKEDIGKFILDILFIFLVFE